MKKLISTAAVLSLFACAPSFAQSISIATGKQGGGYDAAAQVTATKLEQRGFDVDIMNMNGSDEITLAVCRGDAQIGWTQIDAIDARGLEGCQLRPVANYGDGEYAMILFPPESDYNELDDLGPDNSVLVDTIGSGTSLFWDTITRIEKGDYGNNSDWASMKAMNDPLEMASPLANFGDIDAVIMVRTTSSNDLSALIGRGWELGELYDKDINDYQFNGDSLYEPEKLRFSVDGKRVKGYGYKVKSFVVVSNEVARDRSLFATIAGAAQ